jgi:hypothetical protein
MRVPCLAVMVCPNLPFIEGRIKELTAAGNPVRRLVRPGGHIAGGAEREARSYSGSAATFPFSLLSVKRTRFISFCTTKGTWQISM